MTQIENPSVFQEKETPVESSVLTQMHKVIDLRQAILAARHPEGNGALEQESLYLKKFYEVGLRERIQRAEDVDSPEVHDANETATRVLNFVPFRIGCIDERNKYEYVFGFPPGVGGDYRIPAGNPKEFVVSGDNKVILLPGSNYEKALDDLLKKVHPHSPQIILDCHLECKAQYLEQSGKKPSIRRNQYKDHGLIQDVKRKIAIQEAIYRYAGKKYPEKKLDINLTSYNPETNYMYMGLDRVEALAYAEKHGGYTHKVLDDLSTARDMQSPKIISTAQIASDPRVQAVFESHFFIPDWDKSFKDTSKNYWMNIESIMQTEVAEIIRNQVADLYLSEPPDKIENRTQLLLLNAYSGYINNKANIVVAKHNANTVIVSERQYGAFSGVSGFQVSSHSEQIPKDVHLANGIVQSNREEGTAPDITGTYEDYRQAPHSDMFQRIDRTNSPIWEKLANVDFSDLATLDWRTMTEADFVKYLQKKYPEISVNASNILNYLRVKAAQFLDPAEPTAQQIIDGDLHVLYTVTDTKRKPVFIFPLEYKGYTE